MSLKEFLLRLPISGPIIREISRRRHAPPPLPTLDVLEQFGMFSPNSAGSDEARRSLTRQTIQMVFPRLRDLGASLGNSPPKPQKVTEFVAQLGRGEIVEKAREAFQQNGSDKASVHGYYEVYAAILQDTAAVASVLEIGMGTNNETIVSTMGSAGTPGASLRAFRDLLPNAIIYGADLDENILFQEERIQTFPVDQTDPRTLQVLAEKLPDNMDLIIDDGLHSPDANIAVLQMALSKIKPGGWVVVEDIAPAAVPIWEVVAYLLSGDVYEVHLIQDKVALMFLVRRK
jgi:hypothetical protein